MYENAVTEPMALLADLKINTHLSEKKMMGWEKAADFFNKVLEQSHQDAWIKRC